MYELSNLISMLRRDLADYGSELNPTFLLGKLADSSAELSLYVKTINLIEENENYFLSEEPSEPIKRLISINAAIDYITTEYLILKKTSEEVREPGLAYSYSIASNIAKLSLSNLLAKREAILKSLDSGEFDATYHDLIEALRRKDGY